LDQSLVLLIRHVGQYLAGLCLPVVSPQSMQVENERGL
jgi:hypothetical protein